MCLYIKKFNCFGTLPNKKLSTHRSELFLNTPNYEKFLFVFFYLGTKKFQFLGFISDTKSLLLYHGVGCA